MALTGKTIGQLDHLTSSLTGNEAFPIQYNGSTYHISQSQIVANLATTGSNRFIGNQTISGSLAVTGSITLGGGARLTNQYDYPSIDIQAGIGGYVELLSNNQSSSLILTNQNVVIATSGGAWIFGENGTTSYPANVIAASFTGSLFGTASWAQKAVTASSADNFLVRGTLTAQTIVAQTITSSTEFITGSTKFGSLITDTHQFTGSVSVTGSLAINNISGSNAPLGFLDIPTATSSGKGLIIGRGVGTNAGVGVSMYASNQTSLNIQATNGGIVTIYAASFNADTDIQANTFRPLTVGGTISLLDRYGGSATMQLLGNSQNVRIGNTSIDTGYRLSVYSTGPSNTSSGSLYSNGLSTFDGNISGSQPSSNPSASLILISGSITPTGSLSGSSAILMNTVMSASANNQTLVGLDIAPQFNNGAFTGTTNTGLRIKAPTLTNSLQILSSTNTSLFTISANEASSYIDLGGYGNTMRMSSNGSGFQFYGVIGSNNGATFKGYAAGGGIPIAINAFSNQSVNLFNVNSSTGTGDIFSIRGNGNTTIGNISDLGYKVQISGSGAASGSLFIDGLSTFTGNISGSQPANNPSSSLILISGSITPTGSVGGSSAVLMNTVISASANSHILVGLDIRPSFNNGAFSNIKNYEIRLANGNIQTSGFNLLVNDVGILSADTGNTYLTGRSLTSPINFLLGSTQFGRFFGTTGNFALQNGGTFTDNGYRLQVQGSGSLSGSLYVSGSSVMSGSLSVIGNTQIGTTTDAGYKLDVNGTARVSGGTAGSLIITTSYFGILTGTSGLSIANNNNSTELFRLFNNGNLLLQNGGTFTDNGYKLQVQGSGSPSGSLFVSGSSLLSGSLNVIGNTTITGSLFINNSQFNNTSSLTTAGTTTISSLNTASYISAFYNYAIISSSNARAGQIMSIWSGSTIRYTEAVTSDIGSTSTASFAVALSGGNVNLNVTAPAGWTVRTITNLL